MWCWTFFKENKLKWRWVRDWFLFLSCSYCSSGAAGVPFIGFFHWGAGVKACGIQMKSSFLKPFSTWTSSVSAQVLNTRNCSFLFRKNSFHLVSKSLVFKECHSFIPRSQSFLKVSRHSFSNVPIGKEKKKRKSNFFVLFSNCCQQSSERHLLDVAH